MNALLTPCRYAIEQLETIDGTWRPVVINGHPLAYRYFPLAEQVARGRGADNRVHDTGGTDA
jgi:hypothetical protein